MRTETIQGKRIEYSDAIGFGKTVIDVHKGLKSKDIHTVKNTLLVTATYNPNQANNTFKEKLDITTWLPSASKEYKTSPDISDYIFVPVFTIPSDLPNRNSVAFPLQALTEYSVSAGRLGYKTFKGKPCHLEHDNQDPTKAYGVIADCSLRRLNGFGGGKVWKLMELLAIDRSKHPGIANKILRREYNSYSMGAMVSRYTCSICNANITARSTCGHVGPPGTLDFKEFSGNLAYKKVWGVDGIETSIVATPAFSTATSDWLMTF